jgi:hypothetical protein
MYYPKSQIKTNLYTSGNEFALESTPNTSYTGYYYKTSIGQSYTGKTPQDGENKKLIPISRRGDDIEGLLLDTPSFQKAPITLSYITPTPSTTPPVERFLPSYNAPKPTEEDYTLGEFQRYFCKKTNELIYLEINKDTFQQLLDEDPKIAFDLYNPINTPWSLTGTPQSVFDTNKKIIALIERNQQWYGFVKYFQDKFLQYHISEQNENLYTSGGEYTLPDGRVYVGFYHIMNNGSIMTGKEHGTGGDIVLIPITIKVTSSVTQTSSPSPSPQASLGGGGY